MSLDTTRIAQKESSSQKATKPVFTLTEPEVVDKLAEMLDDEETLKYGIENSKNMVRSEAFQFWLSQPGAVKTVVARGETRDLDLSFTDGWRADATKLKPKIIAVIGEKAYTEFFQESTVVEVDFDQVTESAQQKLFNEMVKLFERHGFAKALVSKTKSLPISGFNEVRRTALTKAENLALDGILATPSSVKRAAEKKE